ncbi:MAG: hypothetical protein QOK43_1981 [Acidimicrobiaceae bacterium]|nr:hypothetical protein [Acidimicrobiaceae bacterium]
MVLALAVCAGLLGSCGEGRHSSGRGAQPVRRLTIEVTEGADRRTATIACGGPSRGTGYLSVPRQASAACITAYISAPVTDYLERDKLPTGASCNRATPRHEGATAHIYGPWVGGNRIDRTLRPNSDCEATMWNLMLPVFQPMDDPLVGNSPR